MNTRWGLAFINLNITVITSVTLSALTGVSINTIHTCTFGVKTEIAQLKSFESMIIPFQYIGCNPCEFFWFVAIIGLCAAKQPWIFALLTMRTTVWNEVRLRKDAASEADARKSTFSAFWGFACLSAQIRMSITDMLYFWYTFSDVDFVLRTWFTENCVN